MPSGAGRLLVEALPLRVAAVAGRPERANANYVLTTLEHASAGCVNGRFDALVTGPVQKSVINEAGVAFSGHTEYLAQLTGSAQPVMMLVAGELRVALLTTHLALREVPAAVTTGRLDAVVRVLADGLTQLFGIGRPRIAVLGLNPHAGEAGHLGTEEREIIAPALDALRGTGIAVIGPLPADTAFTPDRLRTFDAVLAMYHDQGLPVLKYAGFGQAVNVTLGLPIIRTSVDHGTALDLAGTGRADSGSMRAAISLAVELVARRAA